MKKRYIPLFAVLVLCGFSCTSQKPAVSHVVLFWLKEPGDQAAIDRIIETSNSFKAIPGVKRVMAGRPLPSTRPVVDSSFDVALVMEFADEAALHAYEVHPDHQRAVREVLRPLAGKIVVYDVQRGSAGGKRNAGAATTASASR